MLSLSNYLPSPKSITNNPLLKLVTEPWFEDLRIQIHCVEELAKPRKHPEYQTPRFYVKAGVLGQNPGCMSQEQKTAAREVDRGGRGTTCVAWYHAMEFKICTIECMFKKSSLEFLVMQENKKLGDQVIGVVNVPLEEIYEDLEFGFYRYPIVSEIDQKTKGNLVFSILDKESYNNSKALEPK